MNLKKRLIIFGTAIVMICSGYHLYKKNNPYNSKNITFINQQLDDFSTKMERFIENDFKNFERLMTNFSSGKYDECSATEVTTFEKYMNTILTCNFNDYEPKRYSERDKSGFLINFENYFQEGTDEYEMVRWAAEQYQTIIKHTYRYEHANTAKLTQECGLYYNCYEDTIKKIDPFARYIVLKLIRPILDLESYNDLSYELKGKAYYHVYLAKVDKDLEECLKYMRRKCNDVVRYR